MHQTGSFHTVEFLEQWINRDDNPFTNAFAALQAMSAKGYYEAIKQMANSSLTLVEAVKIADIQEE